MSNTNTKRNEIIEFMIADAGYALVDSFQEMTVNDENIELVDHYGDEVVITREDLVTAMDTWAEDILNQDGINSYFVRAAENIKNENWDVLDYDAVVVSDIFNIAADAVAK